MSEETTNESAQTSAEPTGFADQQTSESPVTESSTTPSTASDEPKGFADDAPSSEQSSESEAPKEEDKKEDKKEDKSEDYTLTSPENLPLPEENLKSFTDACHKAGLSKEQADAMLSWHEQHHQAVQQYNAQMWGDTLKGWSDELASDAEFGGSHLKETYGYAIKALNHFDDDSGSLKSMLRETKYQFNPTIIRAFARVGRAMGEHQFVGQRGEGVAETPLEKRFYPNM